MQIITEGGGWYQAANDQKNTVWQYAYGDWTSVTKVSYDRKPYQNYHQIGVAIYDSDRTWLQWRAEYNGSLRIALSKQINNTSTAVGNTTTGVSSLPDNDGRQNVAPTRRCEK